MNNTAFSSVVFRTIISMIVMLSIFILGTYVANAQMPAPLQTEIVASGLFIPTVIDFASDGRMFVAEKNGTVRIVKNGQALPTPFITLTDVNTHADRGLIGMALDEGFASNGYVYLSYTYENNPADPFGAKTSRIVRVTANGDVADMSTYTVLVGSVAGSPSAPSCHDFAITDDCIPSDSESHSVGGLRFHDGYLWATTGDGAGFINADPNAYLAQDIDSLAGKFLRLNRDGTAPAGNPYYDGDPTSNRSKVYAYGFRNAYRFNVRPSTGAWYVADVGWYDREEVNVIVPGANYGWPCKEGTMFHPGYDCAPSGPGAVIDPIYEYERNYSANPNDAIAVTGGDFIYSPAYGAGLNDNYIFGDFHRNTISRMVVNADNVVQSVEQWTADAAGPVAFTTGPDGFVYYVSIFTGQVRRIADRTGQSAPIAAFTADPVSGAAPHSVVFDASASSDPDGGPLSFMWTFGDGAYHEGPTISHTYTDEGTYTARLTVMDAGGNIDRETVTITVGSTDDTFGADPVMTSLTVTPAEFVVGSIGSIAPTIFNSGAPDPIIVLINVYNNETGALVDTSDQLVTIPTDTSRSVSMTWIPADDGVYRVSIGLFTSDWSQMYSWIDNARLISVLDRHPGNGADEPTGPFAPIRVETTVDPNPIADTVDETTITHTLSNEGVSGSVWTLLVITDEAGTNVHEEAQLVAVSAGGTTTVTNAWTSAVPGEYFIDLGLFSEDWGTMYEWGWHVGTVSVFPNGGTFEGVVLEEVSTSAVVTPGTPDEATFRIVFDVTALNETVFIPREGGIAYEIIDEDGNVVSSVVTIADTVSSNAFVTADQFRIDEDATRRFTLDVMMIMAEPGSYALRVTGINAPHSLYPFDLIQTEYATITNVGDGEPTDPSDPFTLDVTTATAADGAPGSALALNASIANTGAAGTGNILFVVNDGSENVYERVFGPEAFAAGATRSFADTWIPTTAGTYYFDVGVFSADWGTMYEWGWRLDTIVVAEAGSGDPDPVDPSPTDPSGPFTPAVASATGADGTVGATLDLNATIANTGGAGLANVLFVVNDGAANVFERAYDIDFATGETISIDDVWTPADSGIYYFDVGLFSADWGTMYEWGWRLDTIVVGATGGSGGTAVEIDESSSASTEGSGSEDEVVVDSTEPTTVEFGEESSADEPDDTDSSTSTESGYEFPSYTSPTFDRTFDSSYQRLQDRMNALRTR